MKKKYLLILLIGGTFNVYSQTPDTVFAKTDTVSRVSKKALVFHKPVGYMVPATFIAYGVLAQGTDKLKGFDRYISSDLREDYPRFRTRIDDGLQYMPAVSVYALGLLGVQGKNNFIDKSALYFISNALMGLSVEVLKTQTHKLRPDASDYRSFPSGHTATAFVAAEFMTQEYKDVSPWYGIAAYTMATATGSLRVLNNKHWFSDVVTSAGIGILSTKLAYIAYPMIKSRFLGNKNSKLILLPSYQRGFWVCSVSASLN